MADKFDEFSKHLATTKQTRRGFFRMFGAGIVGAAASAVAVRSADATPAVNNTLPEHRSPWAWLGFLFRLLFGFGRR
jgi:hypothetical protein